MLISTHMNTKGRGKPTRTKRSIDVRSEQGGTDTISFTQKVETWLEVGPILDVSLPWIVSSNVCEAAIANS